LCCNQAPVLAFIKQDSRKKSDLLRFGSGAIASDIINEGSSVQDYYHGDPEHFGIPADVRLELEDDALDKLMNVKFPSDVAQLGDGTPSQEQYESLDPMTTLQNKKTFLSLFPNRFASSIKRGKSGDWRQTSQFHHLSDEEILDAIGGQSTFTRACMPDKNTRFITILLEKDSYYRTPIGLAKIRDCFRCVGVNQMKLYMLNESEQWQLFAFFKSPINSEVVTTLVASWLRRNGIVPDTAGLTIYPGAEPLCFPLQPGFCWINDNGHIIVARNEVAAEAALGLFISDMDRTETDGQELIERLEQILSSPEKK
jgi:hypothetical protein